MPDTAKRIVGPVQLGTVGSVLYTVPASTTTIIQHIRLVNVTAGDVTFNLSIGADAVGTRLFSEVALPARGIIDSTGFIVMATTETLQGLSNTATAVTVTVSAVEVT